MKRVAITLLAILILLAGAVPSDAWAHGVGWWAPGLFFGGLALGTALAYPYYTHPYAYPYGYAYPYPAPTYEPAPVQPPLVQRDVCYDSGCYHLYGDGRTQPWQWVWTPAAPPPPASR